MSSIVETINEGIVLVSDGAWGTFLQRLGLKSGECPELWNIEKAAEVKSIAKAYVDAGADMIKTNSFGGNHFKLAHWNLEKRVREINRAAAQISREAAGSKYVIASVGPTGKLIAAGDVTEKELENAFQEQAYALAEGGADAVCIETMSDLTEASCAVRAALKTKKEVIVTFTFSRTAQGEYRTMTGISPEEAASVMDREGAHIIGANCGNGVEQMIEITGLMRSVTNKPLLIHANAGLPRLVEGKDIYDEEPEQMASRVRELIDAGADIIGGCCGTTPEHIKAVKAEV